MKDTSSLVPPLYQSLSKELEEKKIGLSASASGAGGWRRRPAQVTPRHFIAALARFAPEFTGPVVFTVEEASGSCILRFCRPIRPEEHDRLAASDYAPMLRSKLRLSVGLGQCGAVHYAYSEIRLGQRSDAAEMFEAMLVLGRELREYLRTL